MIFLWEFFSDFWYTQNHLMVLMGWFFGQFKNESMIETCPIFPAKQSHNMASFSRAICTCPLPLGWTLRISGGRLVATTPERQKSEKCGDLGMLRWRHGPLEVQQRYARICWVWNTKTPFPFLAIHERAWSESFLKLRWSQFCTKCCGWPDAVVWPSAALCGKLSSKTLGCFNIPSHPIPSHPIPSHPIPSHPIPSHPMVGFQRTLKRMSTMWSRVFDTS